VTLLAAIRGKKKPTVGKLTHAIAEAGRGSINAALVDPVAFKSGRIGPPRMRWRAFVMQLPCKSEKLLYIFLMSFKGSLAKNVGAGDLVGER
jgi:hypothetical protein